MSEIEWTDVSWNPLTGCTEVSPGCWSCYAKRMARRLAGRYGYPPYPDHFKLTYHKDRLSQPLHWKKPHRIFVNSMSDTFHEDVPDTFIHSIFSTMNRGNWHQFQVLTKRSERLAEMSLELTWSENIWMGVSIEREDYLWRLHDLEQSGAAIKFISLEPLLGEIPDVDLTDIDWAIVGCESGPGARPMNEDWVRSIRDQCIEQNVAFFYKQRMLNGKKISCPELDGVVWNQYPNLQKQFSFL